MPNALICANVYNGTILWTRDLPEAFMIQRNTMVATPDTLYLADHESCKLIDAATGAIKHEIVVPAELSDGPVWKWMALVAGVLYALVGGGVAAGPRALAGNRRVFLNPVPEAIVMGVERTAPTLVPSFHVQTRRSDDSNPWPVTEEQS